MPVPTATPEGGVAPVKPVLSPKKETARLDAPLSPKPLPAATLKLEKTQQLAPAPVPMLRPVEKPGALVPASPGNTSLITDDAGDVEAGGESVSMATSASIFALSLAAFAVQLWMYLKG